MAYSKDLRERIIKAIKIEKLSKSKTVKIFKISRTGLDYLLKHYKETNSLDPKPHGEGRPPKFQEEDIERIKIFLDKHPDATLEEILEHSRKNASITSVHRTLNKIGYRLKKSRYSPVKEIEKM